MTASPEQREQLGIVFCPKCGVDTLPHDRTGKCLFCDTVLVKDGVPVYKPKLVAASGDRRKWTRETVLAFLHTFVREHGRTPGQRDDGGWAAATKGLFGNVGNACVEAGYPRPIRGKDNYVKPLDAGDPGAAPAEPPRAVPASRADSALLAEPTVSSPASSGPDVDEPASVDNDERPDRPPAAADADVRPGPLDLSPRLRDALIEVLEATAEHLRVVG